MKIKANQLSLENQLISLLTQLQEIVE